ncbi:MAG: DUF2073 domain-containing protein [Candidatus Aenigmatarchaeota archaeon]
MAKKTKDGVKIEFLSQLRLQEKAFEEKLDLIMDSVKENNILVLEEALDPEEKAKLIEKSMEECDEDFPGIEFSGFDARQNWLEKILGSLTGKEKKDGLLIVGSSDVMEKVEEDKDAISMIAKLE